MPPPIEQEFGQVAAIEVKRRANRGAMQPLLCCADDGAHYILKPFAEDRSWPLVLEWISARLGRAVGLPIPNYRHVAVSEELAGAWNDFSDRKIEPGIGFGSQLVDNALEFEPSMENAIPAELRLRILAFDWWIRNRDRGEKNPNLLWSAETRNLHVIDHDQAANTEDASLFWGTHLFKTVAQNEMTWLPPELARQFTQAFAALMPEPLLSELPSPWTTNQEGVTWFIRQLEQSLTDATHRKWKQHD